MLTAACFAGFALHGFTAALEVPLHNHHGACAVLAASVGVNGFCQLSEDEKRHCMGPQAAEMEQHLDIAAAAVHMVARSGVPRGTTVPGLPTVVLLHGQNLQRLVVVKHRDGTHTVRVFDDGTPAVPAGCITVCIPHMAGIQRSMRSGNATWLWNACRGLREGLRAVVKILTQREPTAEEWAEMAAAFPPLRIDSAAKARAVADVARREHADFLELLIRLTAAGRRHEAVADVLPCAAAAFAQRYYPEALTVGELHLAVSAYGGEQAALAREAAVRTTVDGGAELPQKVVGFLGMGIQGMGNAPLSLREAMRAAAERSTRVGAGAKRALGDVVDLYLPGAAKEERGKLGMGLQLALKKGLPPTREVALQLFDESTSESLGTARGELYRLKETVVPEELRAATARLQAEPAATNVVQPVAKGMDRAEQQAWKRLRSEQQEEGAARDTFKLAVAVARQAEGAMSRRGKTAGGVKQLGGSTSSARANVWKSWQVEFAGQRSEAEAQRTMDVLYIVRGGVPQFFTRAGEYPLEALAPLPKFVIVVTPPTEDRAALKESLRELVKLVAAWRAATATIDDVLAARRALGQLAARMMQARFWESWEMNGRPYAV